MCCKKKQKRNAGMTLIELMVSVALLAVVFLAIMRLCGTATMMAINSRKMTALVYAAEMNMERLIGLNRSEMLALGIGGGGYPESVVPEESYDVSEGVAAINAIPSITTDIEEYWAFLDDGNQERDDRTSSKFVVTFKKEDLSDLSPAYKNLVRITVTAREIPRAENENVMSYTLTNVLYVVEEVPEP